MYGDECSTKNEQIVSHSTGKGRHGRLSARTGWSALDHCDAFDERIVLESGNGN